MKEVGIKIELWPIDRVIPYEKNAKKHPPQQIEALAKLIGRGRWDQPIVVDKDGVVIKGHGRRLAAIKLGLAKVPVVVRDDLTKAQADAERLSDNRVAATDYDTEKLGEELARLMQEEQIDFSGIFDEKELGFLPTDLGEMNTGAFVSDMGQVIADQKSDIAARAEAASESQVPIARALGFKSVPTASQHVINRVLAEATKEAGEGADPAQAFVNWLQLRLDAAIQ
jgi:hypothetical protein